MREVRLPLLPAWLRWFGVAVVAGVIFYLSVVTTPPADPIVEPPELIPLDKWRHFFAYAAFGGSLAYATTDWGWSTRRLALLVLGTTVLYGVGIEVWQSFVPGRYMSLGDAYANGLGAVLVSPWYVIRSRVSFVPVGEFVPSFTE
ncbi:VanZ like family protein [Halomicrobium zhouii]|uniref:VanZ like family protein n=1 Tax=Halomicrobium zhouii TaxID=767519 RepID=A0A1I6KQD9_9EURY|nr:VanZ family protein [Halomicrobium zhouii]SFR93465.1 VanZ like family protein [Halomicrobium zhouii]